jgi:hypothetical protein
LAHSPEEKYFTFLHLENASVSEDDLTTWVRPPRRASLNPNPAFYESFSVAKRLNFVVFCDSLGTCAFECPDLRVIGLANAV